MSGISQENNTASLSRLAEWLGTEYIGLGEDNDNHLLYFSLDLQNFTEALSAEFHQCFEVHVVGISGV